MKTDITDRDSVGVMVERAVEWVLAMRRPDGTILWAREEAASPWDYALLTGSASIAHALRCAAAIARLVAHPRPSWSRFAGRLERIVATEPERFEPVVENVRPTAMIRCS